MRLYRRMGADCQVRCIALALAFAGFELAGCKKDEPAGQESPVPAPGGVRDPAGAQREKDGGSDGESNEVVGVREDGHIVSAVDWFSGSLEDALGQARLEDKLVLVHVGAYWCPPCHRLEEEVFTLPHVGELLRQGWICVHIDAEKGEGPEIVDRYQVQAYPTLLVLEPSGIEKGRIVDFVDATKLEHALGRIAKGENVLFELEAGVQAVPDDLEARYHLAHALALAARAEEARTHYDVIVVGDPTDEMGLHSNVLYDRAMFFTHKLDGDRSGAIAEYEALQRRFPGSKAAVRAYRQIGRLLHQDGRSAEAIASLDRMLATHPDDPALAASYGWFSFRERCEPARGLEVVERALEQHGDDPELHYLRAELQHLVGNDAAALDAIGAASRLEPQSAFYKRQRRRFADLVGSAR
jgi:thioredoxin-like negative regulator of GroEL